MAESKLSILVQAVGAAKAAKELRGVDAAVSRIGARAGQGIRTAGSNLLRLGTIAAGVAAAGVAASVKVAADFESQLNIINTVARATPEGLEAIGAGIRKLARDTGAELGDLTQGYYDLVSAGISTADAQKVLTVANQLAVGGLSTTAEAVDLLTTAINVYGGDASKATQFADEFAKEGIALISSSTYLTHLLPAPGTLTRRALSKEEQADLELGFRAAKTVAGFDIGQCVVVQDGAVVAVEAMEGTDATVARAGEIARTHGRRPRLVVVKVAKPKQDFRFDLPVLGLDTLPVLERAGACVLALEAGKTLIFDREEFLRRADAQNLSVVAVAEESVVKGHRP